MKVIDTLMKLRDEFSTPLSGEHRASLLNAAALEHKDDGWGLRAAVKGQPTITRRDGVEIADGILFNREQMQLVNVFRDPEGGCKICDDILGPAPIDDFIEPIARKKADPPAPPAADQDNAGDRRGGAAGAAADTAAELKKLGKGQAHLEKKLDEVLALLQGGMVVEGKVTKAGRLTGDIEPSRD